MRHCYSRTKWHQPIATAIGTVLLLLGAVTVLLQRNVHTFHRTLARARSLPRPHSSTPPTVGIVSEKDSRCFDEAATDGEGETTMVRPELNMSLPERLTGPELDEDGIRRHVLRRMSVSNLFDKHAQMSKDINEKAFPCGTPVFLDREQPTVALASTPGSGNTWLRYLLEQLTGVRTGSIYVDKALYWAGFVGENVSNASVLVVKSHTGTTPLHPWYDRTWMDAVILLVRNPYRAALSEFQRRKTRSHLSTVKAKSLHQGFWGKFVVQLSYRFCDIIHSWLTWKRPTLVVFFEDLLANTRRELQRILHFLRVRVSERRWQCALTHKEGHFHRKPFKLKEDPFNKTLQLFIENSLRRTSRILPEVLLRYSRKR